jgi:uncharacterized protein YbjT (DUF2867 family)
MRSDKTILVTGATGQQGNAVARALLADGWTVRALVRDPAKPTAQELQRLDAELAQGDLFDPVSLDRACRGCYGVFGVQTYFIPEGIAGEIEQGKQLAEAAGRAGVEHFVYSSVGSADKETGIPHFQSKWQIEQHIHALRLRATILRPVFFMENFGTFFAPSLENGVYVIRMAVKPTTRLAMVAVADIGAFAALAFRDPDQYVGLALDIGGDLLTVPEACVKMRNQFGRPFAFEPLPISAVRAHSADLALMFQWFDEVGQTLDLAGLRKRCADLMDFSEWLRRSGWDPTRTWQPH